jgi:hypothetical protein
VFMGDGLRDTGVVAEDNSGGSVGMTSLMMVDVMVGRMAAESVEPVIWGCCASFPGEITPKVKEGIVVAERSVSATDVGINMAAVEVASKVATGAAVAPAPTGDGGSISSSDSESSPSDMSPTVDGLLNGESGLSGPSPSAPATGIVLATGSTWRMRFGKTLTGDGRRS